MKQIVAWDRRQVWAGVLGSAACTFVTSLFQNSMTWESVLILVGVALVSAVAGLAVAGMVLGKPEQPELVFSSKPKVAVVLATALALATALLAMGRMAEQLARAPQPERVFSPRSPSELIALTEGKTEIEADDATARHIGTWLQVQGRVVDVSRTLFSEGGISVYLKDSTDEVSIVSTFYSPWSKEAEILTIGDQVTVTGKIDSISNHIRLEKCKLR